VAHLAGHVRLAPGQFPSGRAEPWREERIGIAVGNATGDACCGTGGAAAKGCAATAGSTACPSHWQSRDSPSGDSPPTVGGEGHS
jgi:hypothetical protein